MAGARARGRCEQLAHLVGTPRGAVGTVRIRQGQAGRHQPGAAGLVVPRDDPVVDAEYSIRKVEVVVTVRGKPLEHAAPVVREVASRAALKRRQPLKCVATKGLQPRGGLGKHVPRDLTPPAVHVEHLG